MIFSGYLVVFQLILQDLIVGQKKEIRDVDNHDFNRRFCPCLDRLARESVLDGYAPGTESPFQTGDRHSGRVSLLTPL